MRRPTIAPLVLLAALLAACQTDPVTGKPYYSDLDNDYASQDAYVRGSFLTEISLVNDGGRLPEPGIEVVCREIFARVVQAVPAKHRRGFQYHFILSTSPEVNAYTYGAGRLHCSLGLLAACEDASEFAGILAHEVGHISHDHAGQGRGRQSILNSITSFGGITSGRGILGGIGGLLGGAVLVQYTRSQEREADDRAVDYTLAAGYDPDGIARFFAGMEADRSGLELFRTHPYPENRVRRIRERIREHDGVPEGAMRAEPTFEAARARARKILPRYVELHAALAEGELDTLVEVANAGIAALPNHPQFHFWKGVALDGLGKPKLALASLRRAAELDDSNVLLPLVHANLAFESKEFGQAEASASRVIRIIPAIPVAYLIRGLSRYELGRKDEAFRDFNLMVRMMPEGSRAEWVKEIRKYAPDYSPATGG